MSLNILEEEFEQFVKEKQNESVGDTLTGNVASAVRVDASPDGKWTCVYNEVCCLVYKDTLVEGKITSPFSQICMGQSKIRQIQMLCIRDDNMAIAIGFDDGMFAVYSSKGRYIHGCIYHERPIQKIMARYRAREIDEIYICYSDLTVVLIDGTTFSRYLEMDVQIDPFNSSTSPFGIRKARLGEAREFTDMVFTEQGTEKRIVFIVATRLNLIEEYSLKTKRDGFYSISELAGKMGNMMAQFNTWLFSDDRDIVEPMGSVFKTLKLIPRDGNRVVRLLAITSSLYTRRLLAMADNLGRVLLMDLHHHLVIKVWKGHRVTRMGFVKIKGLDCLVVFSENREQIHVWTLDTEEQTTVEVGLRDKVVVTTGADHSKFIVLRTDGQNTVIGE